MQFTRVASAEVVVDVRTRGVFLMLAEGASLHAAPLTSVLVSSVAEVSAHSSDIRIVPRGRMDRPPGVPRFR